MDKKKISPKIANIIVSTRICPTFRVDFSKRALCIIIVCYALTFIGITWNKVSIKGFKEFLTLRKAEYLEHNSAEAFDISVRISFHVNK